MNGLDLFSGIGGITLALSPWVRPIAYCEIDRYCQGVLLSRMSDGSLPMAPVWDDVRTLRSEHLPIKPDIIYGGFPCQDISRAGGRRGLSGERSGLFYEVIRLCGDVSPRLIFLENVADFVFRGGAEAVAAFAELRYDCKWTIVSAAEVGAAHLRRRLFILAYPRGARLQELVTEIPGTWTTISGPNWLPVPTPKSECDPAEAILGREVLRFPARTHRIRALGNAVVPLQAREAFKRLIMMEREDQ